MLGNPRLPSWQYDLLLTVKTLSLLYSMNKVKEIVVALAPWYIIKRYTAQGLSTKTGKTIGHAIFFTQQSLSKASYRRNFTTTTTQF